MFTQSKLPESQSSNVNVPTDADALMGVFSPVNPSALERAQNQKTVPNHPAKPTSTLLYSEKKENVFMTATTTNMNTSHHSVPSISTLHVHSNPNMNTTTTSNNSNNSSHNIHLSSLIASSIHDALGPVVQVLRQDLQNIHLDLLKQFHLQKMTLQESIVPPRMAALEAELVRLQNENKRLKIKCNEL